MKVKDISDYLNSLYPFSEKCGWDNCGLLIGDEENEVSSIGFALDLTKESLDDAVKNNVNLIVTHHPVIFNAQKNFLKGNIAYEAAVRGISVISCHTCYDSAAGGVSEILAKRLGLDGVCIVETTEKPYCVRMGKIAASQPYEFAQRVSRLLGANVRAALCDREIKNVAVCGGAGGDFIEEVFSFGADAYVTGDIDHHELLLAKELGLTLIAAGHFETESICVLPLLEAVEANFKGTKCIPLKQTNPVIYISAEE